MPCVDAANKGQKLPIRQDRGDRELNHDKRLSRIIPSEMNVAGKLALELDTTKMDIYILRIETDHKPRMKSPGFFEIQEIGDR